MARSRMSPTEPTLMWQGEYSSKKNRLSPAGGEQRLLRLLLTTRYVYVLAKADNLLRSQMVLYCSEQKSKVFMPSNRIFKNNY